MAAAHDSLLQAIELAGARALRSGTNRHPRTPRGPSARGPALERTGPGGRGTCHREQRWHSPGRTACFSTPRALNYSQRGQLQTISLSLMEFTLICI